MSHLSPYLIGCCGAGAWYHRYISDLDCEIVIINERPRSLHLTSLEAVLKCSQVGVSKQPAEQVPRSRVAVGVVVTVGVRVCVHRGVRVHVLGPTVVVAGLMDHFRVCGGRWPISGTVPLTHEVRNAQHSGVEDQVPPAGLGGPLGAG